LKKKKHSVTSNDIVCRIQLIGY